ncbi:MoaD/ThiS family protein [Hyphomicrobium sp.]|uniref:MoaD/ThiS family protein n=1 Tax=Hyphomicrobium sp. TaxID=82 RepID=UPI0025C3DE90|nr:MoaD/ThiS family protein [Hyphomicrobium sp.]MCC7252660.1 MoaD/ThiS family protein [Hyphomicrobium sp.]
MGDRAESAAEVEKVVTVVLPPALLALFPVASREVVLQARTVGGLIAGLDRRWPGMRDRLCDSTPRVRRHINIVVAGQRAALDTPLPEGARVYVLTAISGG